MNLRIAKKYVKIYNQCVNKEYYYTHKKKIDKNVQIVNAYRMNKAMAVFNKHYHCSIDTTISHWMNKEEEKWYYGR